LFFLNFLSCANTRYFARLDDEVGRNNFSGAIEQLEKNKSSLYSNRNNILYYLDKGMLSHFAELHTDSSKLLENAETAIEAAYTKSITQEIGSYLVNDNIRDYPGEDYEDVYINVFNSLNYYHRGMIESAMVEIRKMNEKLEFLSTKYDLIVSGLQKKAIEDKLENIPSNPDAPVNFSDSALARYMGMLFYRSSGLEDSARIDSEMLKVAFTNAPQIYTFPPPSSLAGELDIPRGMARLNIIAFSGLSPIKESNVMRILIPGPRWIKISLPVMVSRPSEVSRIELVFDNSERFSLELLEDIEKVAIETFRTRQNVIYLKSVIRAMIKAIGSSVLGIAAGENEGNTRAILQLLSLFTQISAEVTEEADLRISRYFPARAYVGGINLDPGTYSFDVVYYNRSGKQIAVEQYRDILIRENALNLIQSFHLK